MSDLGARLKQARENKRLTQQEVADKFGVSNGTISGYERNYRDPDSDTLAQLADLYDVSLDWLKGRDKKRANIRSPKMLWLGSLKRQKQNSRLVCRMILLWSRL